MADQRRPDATPPEPGQPGEGRRRAPPKERGDPQALAHELSVHQAELEAQNEELRRAHIELLELHERYLDLYERAPVGYVSLVRDGRVAEANLTAAAVLGVARRDLLGRRLSDFVVREQRDELDRHRLAVLDGGARQDCEVALCCGPVVRLESIRVAQDGEKRCRTALLDITERRAAEEALQELNAELEERVLARTAELERSERAYRMLVERIPAMFVHIGRDLRYRFVNERFAELLGQRADAIVGRAVEEVLGEEAFAQSRPRIEVVLRSGVERRYEAEVELAGERRTLQFTSVPDVREGRVEGLYALMHDVTEQRRAEEQRRRAAEFSTRIVETSEHIVLVLDAAGRIVVFNPYLARLTGWRLEEVQGTDWFGRFVPERERERLREEYAREIGAERPCRSTSAIVTRDGRERTITWADAPLGDGDSGLLGVLCTGQDITERRRLRREVVEVCAAEQQRIGRSLHDSTQQQLFGLVLLTDSVRRGLGELAAGRFEPGEELAGRLREYGARIEQVYLALSETAAEVSRLARGLIPVEVDSEGLRAALSDLVCELRREQPGVALAFACERPYEVADNFTATHLYHIAREAVVNALRHSGCDRIAVRLGERRGRIEVRVADNGRGMAGRSEPRGATGLQVMRYRADLIDATLRITEAKDGGTEVCCSVPRC